MVSAIVLAAGESRRMGEQNKLLLPFRGKTIIEHLVETLSASNAAEIVVVLGHEADRIKNALSHRNLIFAINANYREGMATSIHAGVTAASPYADGFMICLADLPFIEAVEFNELINHFEKALAANPRQIVVPAFNGRRGNPVIFSSFYRDEILACKGIVGCKGLIKQNSRQVLETRMDSDHILKDIDTLEDYRQLTG
jgi:molybdenum cofactor cytidylyltransferase